MWQCRHCNNLFDFQRATEKANHSKYCENNPKNNDKSRFDNLKLAMQNKSALKLGVIRNFKVVCCKCNTEFEVIEHEKEFPKKLKYYCSRACANGHFVSKEHRAKVSKSLTKIEIQQKSCEFCKTMFKTKRKQSRFCSSKCANLNKSKLAKIHRSPLANYRTECSFNFSLNDFPNEFDFSLIEQFGWYKPKNHGNNLNGVSRDHMVSVKFGFDNKINPAIIAHPANCRLLRHNDNVSKNHKNSITLDELMIKIEEWNRKYK